MPRNRGSGEKVDYDERNNGGKDVGTYKNKGNAKYVYNYNDITRYDISMRKFQNYITWVAQIREKGEN